MRVGYEVGLSRCLGDETPERLPMPVGRRRNPHWLTVEPLFDLRPGGTRRLGALEDARVGHHSQERHQALPREADAHGAIQLTIEPRVCRVMLWQVGDVRVDQEIGVDEDQR